MKLTENGDAQVRGGYRTVIFVFVIMKQRQGMSRWLYDPVRQQGRHIWMGRRGRNGLPPWTDIGLQEERAMRVYIQDV